MTPDIEVQVVVRSYEEVLREVSPDCRSCMEALRRKLLADLRSNRFTIPPLPMAFIELQQLTEAEEPDLGLARRLIERDANLAGRVTFVASSAAYGQPVRDLGQAITRLGVRGLRSVVYALMLSGVFKGDGPYYALMERELVLGFTKGRAAQLTFEALGLDDKLGFLAGLMADVGRLTIIHALADYPQTKALETAQIVPIIDKLHTEVGPLVLSRWRLAPELWSVAQHHHQPEAARDARDEVAAAAFALSLVELLETIDVEGVIDDETVRWLSRELPVHPPLFATHVARIVQETQRARQIAL